MKTYIKMMFVLATLFMGAANGLWAQTTEEIVPGNIIVNGGTKSGNSYTLKDGSSTAGTVAVAVSERKVTLTITPASGYMTKKSLILVERMVKAANLARRRSPNLADIIAGEMYTHGTTTLITSVENPNEADYVFTVPANYDGAYVTVTFVKKETDVTFITSLSEITNPSGSYKLAADISGGEVNADAKTFSGTLDGNGHKIYNLSTPIFNSLSGTVKNVMLEGVTISSGDENGNTGAIACEANLNARIYNCGILPTIAIRDANGEVTGFSGSSVSGSKYVGSLVGLLNGAARVINCFSYSNITSGTYVGGIVGYNNVATSTNSTDETNYLKTMVMNCMFYGDITGGSNKAPIYNGKNISNLGGNGVGNYNYFWGDASYVVNRQISTYNCALMAETRFLQRFEFFRHLMNSHLPLAEWWATGTYHKDKSEMTEMLKWVLEPSQLDSDNPFPILQEPGYYPSVVNIDAKNATVKSEQNKGGKLINLGTNGQLSVTINMGSGGAVYGPPSGATITQNTPLTLNITDKDPDHFNFNYGKVQLPYYNDVGTNNYRKASDGASRVVTGWKIVSITVNGTPTTSGTGSWSTGSDAEINVTTGIITSTPYNFADRNSTKKDLYGVSGRVFNQGAYWDVPEGVTAITIEPYWAKVVYLADANADVVYDKNMAVKTDVPNVGGGQIYTNGESYTIAGENQVVYTTASTRDVTNAITALFNGIDASGHSVYDYAIVLVGNYHHYSPAPSNANTDNINGNKSQPYTIMSIDNDHDNEPDYSLILRFDGRIAFHPIRFDFINIPGLGMAQKSTTGGGTYNFGIMQPQGWFESTNTSLFRFTQFEYDVKGRVNSPIILQGGVIEQWVTVGGSEESIKEGKTVSYYHVGGNVWFKEFHIGVHQDKIQAEFFSPHPPISVTGGDFDEFYLTGYYNTPDLNAEDNAECYINGGRFGKVAGTGMQGIGKTGGADNTGNIIWQIDNADIDEFYAGGINAAHIAEGNIYTVITNSRVDQFCGGPKFGDMNSDKKVVTNATNCIFRTFFGAGYGGNSYNRRYPNNQNNVTNIDWDAWVREQYTNIYEGTQYKGVETRIDYQFIPMSGNASNVARLFVDYVSFSLATTYDVTSKLTGCTITRSPLGKLDLFDQCIGNFYGGGSLGKVNGPVKSTLIDCTVEGNVFGAGYSASKPKVSVMSNSFQKRPFFDSNLGVYQEAILPATTSYEWVHADAVNSTETAINTSTHKLFTEVDLSSSNLGSVSGAVTLTIEGNSTIGTAGNNNTGNVYGGGDQSYVNNTETPANAYTIVNLQGNTHVLGNVFGGGNKGLVSGSATVNIQNE